MSKSFLKKALLGGAVEAGAAVWAIAPRSFYDKRRNYVPAVPDVWYAPRGLHDAGSGPVSDTTLRDHKTVLELVCRVLLEKK